MQQFHHGMHLLTDHWLLRVFLHMKWPRKPTASLLIVQWEPVSFFLFSLSFYLSIETVAHLLTTTITAMKNKKICKQNTEMIIDLAFWAIPSNQDTIICHFHTDSHEKRCCAANPFLPSHHQSARAKNTIISFKTEKFISAIGQAGRNRSQNQFRKPIMRYNVIYNKWLSRARQRGNKCFIKAHIEH